MPKFMRRKIRNAVECLIAAFFSIFQYIPVVGLWHGFMSFPLAVYIFSLLWEYPEFFGQEMHLLLFSRRLMFGRIVAVIGFIIFLAALISLLKGRGRIITTKIYSASRHPQYFGLIIMTWGMSVMCAQYHHGVTSEIFCSWPIIALAYILLACYEERHLIRECKKKYQKYRRKVPFILPIPYPSKIPQPIFTMVVVIIFAFFLTLF